LEVDYSQQLPHKHPINKEKAPSSALNSHTNRPSSLNDFTVQRKRLLIESSKIHRNSNSHSTNKETIPLPRNKSPMEQTEKLSTEKVGSKTVLSSPTSFHESSMEQKKTLEAPNTYKHSLETSPSPFYLHQPSIRPKKAFVPPNQLVKSKSVP